VNLTGIWPEYCCNNYSKISEDYHTENETQIAPEPVKIEIKTGLVKSMGKPVGSGHISASQVKNIR